MIPVISFKYYQVLRANKKEVHELVILRALGPDGLNDDRKKYFPVIFKYYILLMIKKILKGGKWIVPGFCHLEFNLTQIKRKLDRIPDINVPGYEFEILSDDKRIKGVYKIFPVKHVSKYFYKALEDPKVKQYYYEKSYNKESNS